MQKKAVLFDLDGTLVNSLPDISASMNKALAAHNLPTHDMGAYAYFVGNGARILAERASGNQHVDSVLNTYRTLYAEHCFDDSYVYDGVMEMLTALHEAGYKIVVLSNKDDSDVPTVLNHYFPGFPFTIMRGKQPGVPLKPDPASALNIAKELNLTPDEFWYLGDTATDCTCALAAGMHFIGVSYGFRPRAEIEGAGADRVVDTPQEALRIILSK